MGAKKTIWYLGGPMTGIPQFNFPAFFAAAEALREKGYTVISPAELDAQHNADYEVSLNSPDGAPGTTGQTWGDYLARDVKIVADQVGGIIFLPGWEDSRGARLEAFVGVLQGDLFKFAYWDAESQDIIEVPTEAVREFIV